MLEKTPKRTLWFPLRIERLTGDSAWDQQGLEHWAFGESCLVTRLAHHHLLFPIRVFVLEFAKQLVVHAGVMRWSKLKRRFK